MSIFVRLVVALVLIVSACSDTDSLDADTAPPVAEASPDSTSPPSTSAPAVTSTTPAATISAGGAAFAIVAVEFGDNGFVEIANIGDAAGSFDGFWLCQRPSYTEISSGGELAPGESVRIDAGAGFGQLSDASGEIAMYLDNNFGSSASILSYVEWGTTGHGRSSVAVEAGIWDGTAVAADGAASISASSGGATANDWATG